MQIHKHHPQSAIQYPTRLHHLSFLTRTRNRIETIDLTLHEGRRKNSLQQWAGVTINTLMISRDRREKASGGRRNPSHTFQQKSTIASRTLNITRNGTISHEHYSICNPQHWFGYGTKDVFRNTARRDCPSIGRPTLAGAGHELNWFWRGGRAGMSERVRLVGFYENISWVMHVLCRRVRRPRTTSALW